MGAAEPTPWLISLHGAARIEGTGFAPLRPERKTAALLAWLAAEGATPRARLAVLLWPDVVEARARANLRQCLARLRGSAGALIDEDAGVLRLAAAARIGAPGPRDAPLLDAERYDDLPEFAAWLDAERDKRRAAERRTLLTEVRDALHAGQLDRALAAADALLVADRESEEAYRTLMEVLYLRADHAAAIAVWDRCREMLRGLYGVSPSPATQHIGELVLQASQRAPAPLARIDTVPATLLRPPRLVGREQPWRALHAGRAAGHVLCVVGASGIGKSRLLADFAAACGRHASAAARPGDALLPYASLSRLLLATIDRFIPAGALDGDDARAAARLLPRLATLLGGPPPPPVHTDYERTQALLGVARLLGRCVQGGCRLFVFDDLQFADAASAEALTMLAEPTADGTPRTPLAFALGVRSGDAPPASARLLASLAATRSFVRVELQPLDGDALGELLASLDLTLADAPALSRRLFRHVGGNPAFVLESLKLLIARQGHAHGGADAPLPLPPNVREVIDASLALLSEPARHLVQLAAVAGSDYGIELAASALACSPLQLAAPLHELAARQLFDGSAFSHDSVAEAVRAGLPPTLAGFLHRLVAEHLQGHGGEPAAVAGHWRDAGQLRRAGIAYRSAADRAAAASLPAAQCELLDLAAEWLEKAGDAESLFDVLVERLRVHAAPDFTTRRLALMERLEALAGSERQQLTALQFRLGWHADQGVPDVVAPAREAIERALAIGDPALAWGFAMPLAWQLAVGGDVDDALATIERQAVWLQSQPDPVLRAEYHFALGGVHGWADHLAAAIAHYRQAAARFADGGQPVRALPALANQGLMHHWRGEFAPAHRVLAEAGALRDRLLGRGASPLIDVNLAATLRDLARYGEAVQLLEAALEVFGAAGASDDRLNRTDAVVTENHLAQAWLALGQPDRAAACLRSDTGDLAPHLQARRLTLLLRTARRQGRADEALRARAQAQLEATKLPHQRWLLALELACWQPAAQALAEHAAALADPALAERPGLRLHVLLRSAERELEAGRPPAARALLDAWLGAAPGVEPYDIDPAEVLAIALRVASASGNQALAQRLQQRCRDWREAAAARLPAAWRGPFERSLAALGIA